MKNGMRLDRMICEMGAGTRTQAKDAVKAGRVLVNGNPAKDAGMQIDWERDEVLMDGKKLDYRPVRHVMLCKPKGVLTAARDPRQPTVMDLLPPMYAALGCMPAGRLDKDTEGLLIITSDGQLAHRIISPKHEVGKVYEAAVQGELTKEDIRAFSEGLHIRDADGEFDARPAELRILESTAEKSLAQVRVTEGRYHQVKRMFASRGKPVLELKRLSIGALELDPALLPGQWRELEPGEIGLLEQEREGQD